MSRPRAGYIGFNRVPAATALNSAASGVWTLREAEALKRAGTWPVDETQAFIDASGITDSTQKAALQTLVSDLKSSGVWGKLLAIYPFVGGTSSSHKYNLKDARDTDGAYRLTFTGTWTHGSTGATPSGAWADTFLNPSIVFASNTYSLGIYLRTNPASASSYRVDMGCAVQLNNANGRFYSHIVSGDGNSYFDFRSRLTVSNTTYGSATAFHVISRETTSSLKVFNNGTLKDTNTSGSDTYPVPDRSVWLGANNNNDTNARNASNREISFAFLGNALTESQVSDLSDAVADFQVTLGRNV